MGCIMPVGGAPLAMGGGRGGGSDETNGGDTPTGRGGRGSGGTGIGAIAGMPGEKQTVCQAAYEKKNGATINIYLLQNWTLYMYASKWGVRATTGDRTIITLYRVCTVIDQH